MNRIIEQLRAARRKSQIKQAELGAKLGLPQSHISKIEKGETDPRLSTISDMGKLLGHELMLIPSPLVPYIASIVSGKQEEERMWLPDEEKEGNSI